MASMHVTDGLPSKSGTEDGTAFSAVAPSWRPGRRLLIECVDNTSTKADSSILRRLIRMSCWFEPLILRLGPRDFNRPVTATLARRAGHAVRDLWRGPAARRRGAGAFRQHRRRRRHVDRFRYEGDISGQDSAHALTAGVRMTW